MIQLLMDGSLPDDNDVARKVAIQTPCFTIINGVLYFVYNKSNNRKQCVVPSHLRNQIMKENHSGPMSGHFL